MPALFLELRARHTALADDGAESADAELIVVGNRHCNRARAQLLLHNDVAAAATNFGEAVAREDVARFAAGQDPQPTQR